MSLPLLLAQAAQPPVVITQDSSFTWPIVIFLVGIAAAVGESRWRTSRLEKDVEEDRRKREELEKSAGATKQEVAVMASALGRIEKGQENMERMLRDALNRPAA